MRFRSILTFAIVGLLTGGSSQGQGVSPAGSREDGRDLWLTVRLTPRYSEDTQKLLEKCCELPQATQRKKEPISHLLRRYYGIVTDHLLQAFGQLNKTASDNSDQDRVVRMPPGPHWRGTIEVPLSEGDTAFAIAERETGFPAGPTTRKDLERLNPGVDLDHLVVLPAKTGHLI